MSKHPEIPKEVRRRLAAWRDLGLGLVIFFALQLGNWLVERTEFGEQMKLAAYSLIQHRLASTLDPVHIGVAVVDISDLAETEENELKITPRDRLGDILDQVKAHGGRAAGIDVDFSDESGGFSGRGDPQFFQHCLDRSQEMPIYLGIERSMHLSPGEWLGSPDYRQLAAGILKPRASITHMVRWVESNGARLPSMSEALSHHVEAPEKFHWPEWLAEDLFRKPLSEEAAVWPFPVDLSPVSSLEAQRIPFDKLADSGEALRGKVVLIGDATRGKARDTFVIPNSGQAIPGIYLIGAATYTLARFPLFEPTGTGRFLLDLGLTSIVLGGILLLRLCYAGAKREIATRRMETLITVLVLTLSTVGGVLLVRFTHLLWDDFLLALPALAIHPSAQRVLDRVIETRGWSLRPTIFEEPGEHQ